MCFFIFKTYKSESLAMTYIKGFNRNQAVLIPEAIDLLIDKNNEIRFIDSFVVS